MSSKWVKLEDLPEGFWEDCFIAYKNKETKEFGLFDVIKSVSVSKGVSMWYSDNLIAWCDFNTEDFDFIVMKIEQPKVTEEDFK